MIGDFLFRPILKSFAPELVAGFDATVSKAVKWGASKLGIKTAQAAAPEAGATAHVVGEGAEHAAQAAAAKPPTAVEQVTTLLKQNPVKSAAAVAVGAHVVEGKVNPAGKEHSLGERTLMGTTEFTGGVVTAVKATKFLPGILKVLALPIGWAVGSRVGEGVGLATVQSTAALKELDKATSPATTPTNPAADTRTATTTNPAPETTTTNRTATVAPDSGLATQQTERLAAEAGYAAAVKDVIADIGKSGAVSAEHREALATAIDTVTKAEARTLGRDANDQGVKALVAAMGDKMFAEASAPPSSDAGVVPSTTPGMKTASAKPELVPHT